MPFCRRGFVTGFLILFTLVFRSEGVAQTFTDREVSVIADLQSQMIAGVPYELDVTNDDHHTYVQAMLRAAGLKPETRPQLFAVIAKQRTAGKGPGLRPAKGWESAAPQTKAATSLASGDVAPIVPINVISYMDNSNNQSALASLLSSVPGGTQSTHMMVNYRMANSSQPFASSPAYEQYGSGTQFEQSFTAAMPQAGSVIASALFAMTINNVPTMTTTWLADAAPNATDQCVTAPNYNLWQQPSGNPPTIPCPAIGSPCVNKGAVTTNILSCYGRNSQNPPCNYAWGGSGYPPNLLLSICGSMTWPAPITLPITGSYSLYLQRDNDGGCVLQGPQAIGLLPTANFSVSPTNNAVLQYAFTGAAFPSNQCMQTPTTNMYLNLLVGLQLNIGGTGSNYGTATVSSNNSINPHQPYFALMPIIQILQGCVAEGTKVTMANGKTKPIQTIRGDGSEKVIAHPDGQKIAVQGVADGIESNPMIRITDSAGNSVLVSDTHPIVVRQGELIPAREVAIGDSLVTRKGATKVVKLDRVRYGGKVWNLTYGPVERYGVERSTFFANGILVGNMAAQQLMRAELRRRKTSREHVLAALPREWHQDYLNWLSTQSKP